MEESDIEKTTFRTGTGGLYEYTRMQLGLCNVPRTFMRVVDKAFGDLNFQILLVYLGDILVFRSTFEETLSRLETVLSRLSNRDNTYSVNCSVRGYAVLVTWLHLRGPLLILRRCVQLRSGQDQRHYVISVGSWACLAITEDSRRDIRRLLDPFSVSS